MAIYPSCRNKLTLVVTTEIIRKVMSSVRWLTLMVIYGLAQTGGLPETKTGPMLVQGISGIFLAVRKYYVFTKQRTGISGLEKKPVYLSMMVLNGRITPSQMVPLILHII